MKNNFKKELAEINAKCDLIIELVNNLSSDPDFVITRMRELAHRQNMESKVNKSICLKLVHNAE
ncbi:hypothetical protein [Bacteroides sp.]|uniref:hypothetical protein n=1 Tax=Bacteroides sp. TaxID=29523 RepID=UPI00258B06CA|nr:hypothetical protein [Bacteroides sp.]